MYKLFVDIKSDTHFDNSILYKKNMIFLLISDIHRLYKVTCISD